MELMRKIDAKQRGFTLLEILMSMAIGSIVLASGAQFTLDRVDDIKDQSTAQYQRNVAVSAERFIRDNLLTIATPLTINGPATAIQLSTVRSAGYLMAGTGNINPYRQTPCIVVRRLTNRSTGEPRLEALVTTEGGIAIPEKRVPFIAAQGGSYGGYVPAAAPTTAQGAYGTWTTPLSNFSAANCTGISATANRLAFALFFDGASGGGLGDDVLHRVPVPGRPDLNQMNVDLNMGNFNINNAKDIAANGNITATGNIAATGNVTSAVDVSATRDVLAGRDAIIQRDVRAATGNVYGQKVMATSDSPTYGQVELRRWGLLNPTAGIQIRSGGGGTLTLTDDAGAGFGRLLATHGVKEFFYGHSTFSRAGGTPYSAGAATLSLSEQTFADGRSSSIAFHNMGNSEGALELATWGSRRFRMFDNQGVGMGLELTGDLSVGKSASFGGSTFQTNTNTVHSDNWSYITRTAGGVDNASPQVAAGSAYVNDIYLRSIGKWASQLDSTGSPGYISSWSGNGITSNVLNDTGRTLTVQAMGGVNSDNDKLSCSLSGYVDGTRVAGHTENNPAWAKGCTLTYQVPPGSYYYTESAPWPTAVGSFVVWVYKN
jgi:prepilin-type N-terminal cleavage/methylation domain-containing protein